MMGWCDYRFQIDGAILIIWGTVEFNAPAPAPRCDFRPGYATAMKIASPMPDIRHMLSRNCDVAIEPTGNCEQ